MQKPTISIEFHELGGSPYQSVVAEISIDGTNYYLDSMLLDNEDEQADLDVMHGFIGIWEMKAEEENLDFYIDSDVEMEIKKLEENTE